MLNAPHNSAQEAYEAVPTTKSEVSSLADIPLLDGAGSHDRKQPTVQKSARVNVGSLARNTYSAWYFVGHGAVDAVLTFGPVFFLIIASLCIGLNGNSISSYGGHIKAITLLSPTIFPIIYAAILGKLLRRVGLYKAERGTTIGDLERLIGCQSIFSTLERQVSLRRIDILGCSILLAWILSPLGGQASLRLLTTRPLVNTYNSTILYYSIEQYADQTALPIKPGNVSASPFFAPLFVTAIQTSRHRLDSPMDLFGNVRVPDITATEAPTNTWHLITNNTEVSYTSIFGIPIAGVPNSGNATFNLISHYWKTDCFPKDDDPLSNPWQTLFPNESTLADDKPLSPSFKLVINEQNSTDTEIAFTYQTRTNSTLKERSIASIPCTASPSVVESKVSCRDKSCSVIAMRNNPRLPNTLWHDVTPLAIFRTIADRLPGVDVSATQDIDFGNELIERWLLNPNLDLEAFRAGWIDLSLLQVSYFNERLQIAINTFWDATIGGVVRMDQLGVDSSFVSDQTWNSTPIYVTEYKGERYVCNITLAVVTMGISLVLLAAAELSMLLGIVTKTPDMLGFVAASARDNVFFKRQVPSHLGGLEMARMLRDVRVRIGDVKGERDVGHVALATMDSGPRRLSWSRLYD